MEIPLVFIKVPERDENVSSFSKFIKENDVSHVFVNYEYEADELRRDIHSLKYMKETSVTVELLHDQTVIEPGTILTDAGKAMKVFTPHHKSWLAEVFSRAFLLDTVGAPSKNPSRAKKDLSTLFVCKVLQIQQTHQNPSFD